MSAEIVLAERLPSSAVEDMRRSLRAATGPAARIDGRHVRSIGARAAETLARFAAAARGEGRSVTVRVSRDMEDDLRILGLAAAVLGEEIAQ
ncbi:STAS domain-containing protein [Oceaniglobus roseus]|uniref:STAS domain-containing protein n=1 Tax=Oceaniglobus roseus TaxID=1737570 RepID=UPI0012FFF1EF|nr:STAS domain-containing protein [Kandeliimicrobium roseum]